MLITAGFVRIMEAFLHLSNSIEITIQNKAADFVFYGCINNKRHNSHACGNGIALADALQKYVA